ncbi:DUF362 domain-containing protein [Candidatus Bathyarchaeota archaeon]|nr:DUF362 domain-containing protein [Candidatus Bathyarchaeota archaeon]
MKVTPEGSAEIYERLIREPLPAIEVPHKPLRHEIYSLNSKHQVALIRTNDKREGIKEAFHMFGGLSKLIHGVKGEVIIKPNGNTDDAYPRNTSSDAVRFIAEELIASGFQASKICVGESSGRFRGFPTRHTLENMGIKAVADELGINTAYFEEEEWIQIKPPKSVAWPHGIKIPKRIYDAERIILTPILKTHRTPLFSIALKLPVGIIDPVMREWLHNNQNENFINKMIDLSLCFTGDLIVTDAMKFYPSRPRAFNEIAEPGLIIVGSNSVAADAVAVCVMKMHKANRLEETPVREHLSFVVGEERGIGSSKGKDIMLLTKDLVGDSKFKDTVNFIEKELAYERK